MTGWVACPGRWVVWAVVALVVIAVSVVVGVPAACALARRSFPGKRPGDAAVRPADPDPSHHLRHPAGHGAVQVPPGGTITGVILAASILVLVRTVGMFELTFLTAGPESTTLVVALYNSVFAASIRADQSVDAMATICTGSMLVLLIVALRFVNPTQLVTRIREET